MITGAHHKSTIFGEVAEWSNAAVLKTVDPKGSGGSNPSLSAEQWQMWSLRRTENPKELDRNQPAPRKNAPVAQLVEAVDSKPTQ